MILSHYEVKEGQTIFDICSAIEQTQPISYFLLFLSFLSRVSRAIACCTASPHGLLPLTGASGSQLHLGPTNILPLLLLGHLHHLLLGPQQTASLPPGHLHQVAQLGPPLLHLRQGAGGALAHHAFGRRASGLFSFEFNCCWLCGKLQMWQMIKSNTIGFLPGWQRCLGDTSCVVHLARC